MTTTTEEAQPRPAVRPWRLVLALATVLLLVLYLRSGGETTAPTNAEILPPGNGKPVFIEQQRPDTEPIRFKLPHRPGMTVLTATLKAGEIHEEWASEWRGEGQMALLESFGDVASEGGDGLNWQFEVNQVYADRGAGAYELAPGDRVLWRLAPYE